MAKEDPSGYGSGEQRPKLTSKPREPRSWEQLPLFDAEFRERELERQKQELDELRRLEEHAG